MQIDNQKKIHITYDSMEELLNREEYMTKTLQNHLDRNNNDKYISSTEIVMGSDKVALVFTLEETK